jgi:alkanesulfonate monooxygenase SsuD/methylene tetrahydromethanopterin reductase-like flavin-dependent oxidoreductase (luciferase family)
VQRIVRPVSRGPGGDPIEFGLYVPQVGFSWEQIRERALVAEAVGFSSVWFMDHLYPPELPDVASFEAWTVATAVATATTRLRVGHLVLSNTLRHPVLLGKMATTLDVISGGRLDLGIGSGSYPPEHARAGIPWESTRVRSEQLEEALEIVTSMFTGTPTSFEGRHYQVRDLPNLPPPVQRPRPPIHVGGAGERRTLPLVARYADVWNCPTYALGELETKLDVVRAECEHIGRDAAELRVSLEAVLALVETPAELPEALARAERRYPGPGWGLHEGGYIGTPDDVVARIREQAARGITLFVFFTHDRAAPETLRLFAEQVMPAFG